MSLLDPDRIQEEILIGGASEVAMTDFPKEPGEYQEARSELTKSSLIRRNKKQKTIRVHRLIQDGVRAAMGPQILEQIFNLTVSLIFAVWPFVTLIGGTILPGGENAKCSFPMFYDSIISTWTSFSRKGCSRLVSNLLSF
jgi:hypothetical protein